MNHMVVVVPTKVCLGKCGVWCGLGAIFFEEPEPRCVVRVSSSRYRTKIRFVVLHDGFGLRGRRMNFDMDNLRIVLELCQSTLKRVLIWWSRSGEQSLVDPTHENRVGASFCESKERVGEEVQWDLDLGACW